MRTLLTVCCLSVSLAGCSRDEGVYQGKTSGEWIEELNENQFWLRRRASIALVEMGPEAIAPLERMLSSGDMVQSERAADVLAKMGADAVPILIEVLSHEEEQVRDAASEALMDIGPPAVPALIEVMSAPEPQVRAIAMSTLGRMGSPASSASEVLMRIVREDDSPLVCHAGVVALGDLEIDSDEAIQLYIELLRHRHRDVRLGAVRTIEKLGARAEAAIPFLIAAVADSDAYTREAAADALGELGPLSKDAIPVLSAALADQIPVNLVAARALSRISPESVPILVEALEDAEPTLSGEILKSLERLGPAARDSVAVVSQALESPQPSVRRQAAQTLGAIGPAAEVTIAQLILALKDPFASVRIAALDSLGRFGPRAEAALPDLFAIFEEGFAELSLPGSDRTMADQRQDLSGTLRRACARALAKVGAQSDDVVSFLREKVSSENSITRYLAIDALGQMGPIACPAVPILQQNLSDESIMVRVSAALALWRIAESTEGLDVMIAALEERGWWENQFLVTGPSSNQTMIVRRRFNAPDWWPPLAAECVTVIGEMGPRARKAAPTLGLVVRYWSGPVQLRAIESLEEMGNDAVGALPALEKAAVRSRSRRVRDRASMLIRRLKPDRVATGSET